MNERLSIVAALLKEAYIRKTPGKDEWCVFSEKGKNMGCSPSEAGAKKRLQEVEYFKHKEGELSRDVHTRAIDAMIKEAHVEEISDFSLSLMRAALAYFHPETFQQHIALTVLQDEVGGVLKRRHRSQQDAGDYDYAYNMRDGETELSYRTWFPEDPFSGYWAPM